MHKYSVKQKRVKSDQFWQIYLQLSKLIPIIIITAESDSIILYAYTASDHKDCNMHNNTLLSNDKNEYYGNIVHKKASHVSF